MTQSIGPRSGNKDGRKFRVKYYCTIAATEANNLAIGLNKKGSHVFGSFLCLNLNDIVFGELALHTSPAGLLWAASSSKLLRVPLEGGMGDIILRLPNRMPDPCPLSSQCSRLGLELGPLDPETNVLALYDSIPSYPNIFQLNQSNIPIPI